MKALRPDERVLVTSVTVEHEGMMLKASDRYTGKRGRAISFTTTKQEPKVRIEFDDPKLGRVWIPRSRVVPVKDVRFEKLGARVRERVRRLLIG